MSKHLVCVSELWQHVWYLKKYNPLVWLIDTKFICSLNKYIMEPVSDAINKIEKNIEYRTEVQ